MRAQHVLSSNLSTMVRTFLRLGLKQDYPDTGFQDTGYPAPTYKVQFLQSGLLPAPAPGLDLVSTDGAQGQA